MRNFITPFVLAFFLFGCASVPDVTYLDRDEFDYNELAQMFERPTGSVEGQVFLTQRGGEVVYGAGRWVTLNPVCPASTQFVNVVLMNSQGSNTSLKPMSNEYIQYMRYAESDAEGRFQFKDVPYGDYYIYSSVTWEVPHGKIMRTEGGWVLEEIRVKEGAKKTLSLNTFVSPISPHDDTSTPAQKALILDRIK